jgi:hypothetical protein
MVAMTTTELHHHLQDLMAERALAQFEGLGTSTAYLADLDHEIASTHSAFVGAAVTEIAGLRGALYGRMEG